MAESVENGGCDVNCVRGGRAQKGGDFGGSCWGREKITFAVCSIREFFSSKVYVASDSVCSFTVSHHQDAFVIRSQH